MKYTLPKNLVMVAALIASAAAANAGTTNAPAPRPLSVFKDDLAGKDPFFPESTRRSAQPVSPSSPTRETPVIAANVFSLKGISRSSLQPLALINNATIGVGELAEVRANGRPIKIRCREIRERSVLIEIDGTGEMKELKLREGI